MLQMRPEGDLFAECLITISYVGELLGKEGEVGGSHLLVTLHFLFPIPGCGLNCFETDFPLFGVLIHEFPLPNIGKSTHRDFLRTRPRNRSTRDYARCREHPPFATDSP